MNKTILEQYAVGFRQSNGMGAFDPIRLKSLLARLNVITVFRPLGSDFSGMSLKIQEKERTARFILVNSNHSLGKQHFTICHELYHLYFQEDFSSLMCRTGLFDKKDKEEYHADMFASFLLLPEQGVKSLIPENETGQKDRISLKTILKIEHYYCCSRTALLYRLRDLGLISAKSYEQYAQSIKQGALQYGYSTELYEKGNHDVVLGNYGALARELFENEKISESHYISLLTDWGMDEQQLEKLSNGEED